MIIYDSSLQIFYSDKINGRKYFSGFGIRQLGDARHIFNLVNYFSSINLGAKKIVVPEQIHSTNISFLDSPTQERFIKVEETDGVITKNKELILTIKTGDCIPIIFCDKKAGLIGISHQGWRGSLKKMVQKMVARMIEHGGQKESVIVAIGPAIGDCCYDIDDDRYYSFLEEFENYGGQIFHLRSGKRHLSLTQLNYLLLIEAGIKKENIDFFPFCTSCDQKRFFSFRRNKKEDYGEMLSFITINTDDKK